MPNEPQTHAKLQWVMVKEELHHVSDYAHLDRNKRPEAICPVCSRPVTMKLGQIKVHHCAHRAEDVCATTQPESALHLNSKFHIFRQLEQAKALMIQEPCASRCGRHRQYAWIQDWDRMEVEYSLGKARPDIAFIKGGKAVGAIEVFVTHAVSTLSAPTGQTGQNGQIEPEKGQPANGYGEQVKVRVQAYVDTHAGLEVQSINQVLAQLNADGVRAGRTTVAEVLQQSKSSNGATSSF